MHLYITSYPKVLLTLATILLVCSISLSHAQEEEPKPTPSGSPTPATAPEAPIKVERSVPNTVDKQRQLLRDQYPQEDLRTLNANGKPFIGLWRKDMSGDAYGAVLIVPGDGQTANWPNTIDVLRKDLPENGWGTLSIEINTSKQDAAPARNSDNNTPAKESENPALEAGNQAKLKAAIDFLHSEGQYNIVIAAYGGSAARTIEFIGNMENGKAKPRGSNRKKGKFKHPIRALVFINARSSHPENMNASFSNIIWPEIPVLDIFSGGHYLDGLESGKRAKAAKANRLNTYIQLKLLTPTTTLFKGENRLSRRVRGFLNRYAKGVEVER
ncbi:MAG: hypothetical protein ACI93R_002536 [Flavobacteriales bacterium]|jgi:hypothetical protein